MHESPWVWTQPKAKGHFFGLVPTLVLMPTKADHTAEERSCKWDMIGVKGAGGIDMILALLEDFFGGLQQASV